MKNFIIGVVASVVLISCSKKEEQAHSFNPINTSAKIVNPGSGQTITTEEANQEIGSYLQSVGFPGNDSAVHALTIDADSLRAYLSNPQIKKMSFFFAHSTEWAASHYGEAANYRADATTLVIVGVNSAMQPVKNSSNGYVQHMSPCPPLSCVQVSAEGLLP